MGKNVLLVTDLLKSNLEQIRKDLVEDAGYWRRRGKRTAELQMLLDTDEAQVKRSELFNKHCQTKADARITNARYLRQVIKRME